MSLRRDERAVTVQIGAVLMLAIIFAALALYQVNTVPAENNALEYEHNQNVHDEMQELRNAIRNTGTTGNSQSASVTLGTQYPTRTFSMNPPDPGGTLETTDPGPVTITDSDGDDYGPYETRFLAYGPDYNEYRTAPRTVIEHSLLYNQFGEANVSVGSQQLVQNERISLVLLDGNVSETSGRSTSVTLEPLDGPRTKELEAESVLTIPTERPAIWKSELEGNDGVSVRETANDGTIEIELERQYTLEIARIGVGEGAESSDTFVIGNEKNSSSRQSNGTRFDLEWKSATVDGSDESVSGRETGVTAAPSDTVSLTSGVRDTNLQGGRVDFSFSDPHNVIDDSSFDPERTRFEDGNATVSLSVNDAASDGDKATVFASSSSGAIEATVTVETNDDGGGGDGPSSFESASMSNLVSERTDASQTVAFSLDRDLNAGETVTIDLSDPQDSGAGGGQPVIIDYPSVDSESGTLEITQGSGAATLDKSGRGNAVLTYTSGDGGDAAGSLVRITISDIQTGDVAGNEYSAVFELDDGTQATATATFGVAESAGDRTISGTTDGDIYSTGSITVSQSGVVNGDADADGGVTLEYQSEVEGSVTSDGDVDLGQESVVGDDVNARGDVSVGYNAMVKGSITSTGDVSTSQWSVVDRNIEASGTVSLGYESVVKGGVTSGETVTLDQGSNIVGDVTADGVELGYQSTIDSDVFVPSASDIECDSGATINGKSCQDYTNENYSN